MILHSSLLLYMLSSLHNVLAVETKLTYRDFPDGAVVMNLPASAGDMDSSPGLGRSHMPQSNKARVPHLLSLCSRAHRLQSLTPRATTTEAHAPRVHAQQQREATTVRSPHTKMKSCPPSPQLEEAHVQQQRPNAAKNK